MDLLKVDDADSFPRYDRKKVLLLYPIIPQRVIYI